MNGKEGKKTVVAPLAPSEAAHSAAELWGHSLKIK